jgi:hypothetical protein
MSEGNIKKTYLRRVEERDPYLQRGRQAARYTIPSIMPEEGFSKSQGLYTPYQGLGQRGLNNLGSKLMLILMPPDQPMFKLDIDDFQMAVMLEQDQAKRGDLDEAFNRVERAVTTDLAATTMRKSLSMSIKQMLCTGNVAIFQNEDGTALVWRLDQFVVLRNPKGELLEVVIKEEILAETLTPMVREACDCEPTSDSSATGSKPIDLYTMYRWNNDNARWELTQELNGKPVPGSYRSWPAGKSPMLVPTTNRLPGENYGRGYIETVCIGDLISFEGLSKYSLEASAMAAKVLWMKNPNSTVRAKDIEKPNGSVINGNPNDIQALRLEKGNDFSMTANHMATIEKRLEQVFMLNQSVQRNAERVTATEIQFVAQDIEDALGNLYTDLASDFQLPIVNFQLARLTRQKRIPPLPKGVIKPRITTGLAALGRGQDLKKIQGFVNDLNEFGGEEAAAMVNKAEMVKRMGAGHGIDMTGLVKTNEEMAAEAAAAQQAEQQAQMMQSAVPEMAKAAAPAMVEQMQSQTPVAE